MFSPEQVGQLCTLLNLGNDGQQSPDDVGAAATETGDLGGQVVEAVQKLVQAATERDSLVAERDALKAQLAERANNATGAAGEVPVDPETLEMAADAVAAKLSLLVEKAKLTPAARARFAALLLGEPGHRSALALSRKAAAQAGLAAPLAHAVLEALEANDPVELARVVGEKTAGQAVVLGRQTPGDGGYDPQLNQRMTAMANAARGVSPAPSATNA
jgi:hypothetical protein